MIACTFPQKEQCRVWDTVTPGVENKQHAKAAYDTCKSDCQGFNVAWMATASHYRHGNDYITGPNWK